MTACERFERWLDDGMPAAGAAEARAHAGSCPGCAEALRAAEEVEVFLAAPPVAAPAAFTDRVMARVANASLASAEAQPQAADAFPWWTRAAREPAVALAFALAALVLWRGRALATLAAAGAVRLGTSFGEFVEPLGRPMSSLDHLAATLGLPAVQFALALVLAPAIVWASLALYRWTERLTLPRPLAR